MTDLSDFSTRGEFIARHIGPDEIEIQKMLKELSLSSINELIEKAVPKSILSEKPLNLPPAWSEAEALSKIRNLATQNTVNKSYIGMGYHPCLVPSVIQRNILENPGWYTQYTPYQAEISQGRLEALLNFQTMICDLTGMKVSNASLLDESTAAAEAMTMAFNLQGRTYGRSKSLRMTFFVDQNTHPQTIEVLKTRAEPFGIQLQLGNPKEFNENEDVFGVFVQSPNTNGTILALDTISEKAKSINAKLIVCTDLLALPLFKSPGEQGADIVVGNTQRFGVPMGFGGPHAAFLAAKEEFKRNVPGRIVGVSKDIEGRLTYRLALQTREQHIRRERATSNICTAQVLLAIMASMYGVYHGPKGLKRIATRIFKLTQTLKTALIKSGLKVHEGVLFDTIRFTATTATYERALHAGINIRKFSDNEYGISLNETTTLEDLNTLISAILGKAGNNYAEEFSKLANFEIPKEFTRESKFMTHEVFNTHHSETELLRYIQKLQAKDLSLTTSMISLGSCTMKLNATSEMLPVTWPEFGEIHPFAPIDQTTGYVKMIEQLGTWLSEVTGFDAASLQPNAGSQGEYAGLLVIKKYHEENKQLNRNICLIPQSAHGTNPASAVMAGMKVVVVKCDEDGNIDLADLKEKAEINAENLSALMVTYPSTHGVFEEDIKEICEIVHKNGGQVYMDGANMNAQIGLCYPGEYGPDVCHLNLHKTFCIPHGGGGPGVGPIAVKKHLTPYLPGHDVIKLGGEKSIPAISAAPYGSPSILPISWMYIAMMGADGLKLASQVAILSANYIAKRLEPFYPILYKGKSGFVAHECIVDLRDWPERADVSNEDVAKRLMDYGFHAPTMSFPVPGTLMIEPTESESLDELNRFCDAMISIYKEFKAIEDGKADRDSNVLKGAPHTATTVTNSTWERKYTREEAAYPLQYVREYKFWPMVSRIDNAFGDKNFYCTCPAIDEYE